jgi:hypothetical protein
MTDNIKNLILNGIALSSKRPSQGGLRVADFPNKYGLRHGDNAIPKSDGWIGSHNGANGAMTEFSMSDERGFEYPSFVPNTTNANLELLKMEIISPEQAEIARRFADDRLKKGLSPFNDPFLDALKKLPK